MKNTGKAPFIFFSLFIVTSLLFSGCAPQPITATPSMPTRIQTATPI